MILKNSIRPRKNINNQRSHNMKTDKDYIAIKYKDKEEQKTIIRLLYSLGFSRTTISKRPLLLDEYLADPLYYEYISVELSTKNIDGFEHNSNYQTLHSLILPTIGEFIETVIECLKPKALTVKLCFGLSATFTKNHVELNHKEFHQIISLEDIDALYKTAQEYKNDFAE